MTRALALLCLLAAGDVLAESDDAPARFVIAVGYNGDGEGGRPLLSYADDDAARFFMLVHGGAARAWLLTTFDRESARAYGPLADEAAPPTTRELARVLGEAWWLVRSAAKEGKRTELVFYFAGHGDVSAGGEGFVVLADGAFTRSDLETQIVAASPADLAHIVLDACSSYFMVSARGTEQSTAVPLTPGLLDVLSSPGGAKEAWTRTGTLVSTSGAAEVHESADVGGGVFSFLLRSALAGAADVDGDGRVGYAEVAAYVASASAALEDPRAHLAISARAPAQRPHSALLDLRASGVLRFLVVDQGTADRVRILDARGLPYAELHREGDAPVTIALVGNPFFVVQKGEQEALLVPRSAGAYAISSLSFAAAPRARSATPGPFAGLFRAAYGPSFLQGYLTTSSLVAPTAGAPLVVAWARAGEPAFRMPWWPMATTAYVTAGVLATGAAATTVGNVVAFSALEARFRTSGTLDPTLTLEADAWRTATLALGAASLASVVAGAGFTFLAIDEEDER